jgi:hypothetical protein
VFAEAGMLLLGMRSGQCVYIPAEVQMVERKSKISVGGERVIYIFDTSTTSI